MENNILVKEQKEKLEEKLLKLKDERKSIVKSFDCDKIQNVKIEEFGDTVDTMSLVTYRRLNIQIVEIENILKNCIVVDNENSQVVQIGSTFAVTLDFGDEVLEDSFTLVDSREGLNGNYVSIDSPFGNSVVGKEICDNFQYSLRTGETVKGIVTGISGVDLDDYYRKLQGEYKLLLEERKEFDQPDKSLLRKIELFNMKIVNYEMLMKVHLLKAETSKRQKTK